MIVCITADFLIFKWITFFCHSKVKTSSAVSEIGVKNVTYFLSSFSDLFRVRKMIWLLVKKGFKDSQNVLLSVRSFTLRLLNIVLVLTKVVVLTYELKRPKTI